MITQQQIDKLRRYLTGQIRTAVENQKGCIGTYYRNKGIPYTQWLQEGGDRDDEYEIAPTVVVQHNWFDTPGGYGSALVYDLYIAPDDGQLCFTVKLDSNDDLELTADKLQFESLQMIVDWLQEQGFISESAPVPGPIPHEFWDFIQRYLPNYFDRYDVFRQGELQLFIDGQNNKDFGLNREEAIEERDRILFRLYHEAIDAFTCMTPEQKVLDEQLDRIEADEDKRERFAELLLEETLTDTEPFGKIAGQVIDAYRNHDCDAMLLAICGWTMKSLVGKTE